MLEAEIARHHALVAADLFRRAAHDEFAKLHHIGAVGDLERGAGVELSANGGELFVVRLASKTFETPSSDAETIKLVPRSVALTQFIALE